MGLEWSWWAIGAVSLGVILTGIIVAGLSPRDHWTDERMAGDLHEMLSRHRECDSGDVFFRVENGTIILFGTVRNEPDKYRVESLAHSVASSAVINHLEISEMARPDGRTAA